MPETDLHITSHEENDVREPSRAEIRFLSTGSSWQHRYDAPLYLNVIQAEEMILASPIDQGGGLRNGDHQYQRVWLNNDAHVVWAPPASTLLLPAKGEARSSSRFEARVESSSYLRVAGRPLIPFAGSNATQSTIVRIANGGECLLLECGCPGRTAMGEIWQFRNLGYRLTFVRNREVVYRERWELRPPAIPDGPGGFSNCGGWATLVAAGPRAIVDAQLVRNELEGPDIQMAYGWVADEIEVTRILDPSGSTIMRLPGVVAAL